MITGAPGGAELDHEHVYGVDPGEVYWAASDIGWVVGHSYIVYGPLFHGCTTCCMRASRSARQMPVRSGV